MTIVFPFFPFHGYFRFPFRLRWVCNQCGRLSQWGVVAFQPSATSEVFSAWHFLIFVLVGRVAVQKRAGDERADVLTAELPVVGALMEQPGCPPLTWSRADACHDTQHVFILSF